MSPRVWTERRESGDDQSEHRAEQQEQRAVAEQRSVAMVSTMLESYRAAASTLGRRLERGRK